MSAKRTLTSAKQAAICKYFGCEIKLKANPKDPRHVLFIVDEAGAGKALDVYHSNQALPVHDVLDALTEIHQLAKVFICQHKQPKDPPPAGVGKDLILTGKEQEHLHG